MVLNRAVTLREEHGAESVQQQGAEEDTLAKEEATLYFVIITKYQGDHIRR
jgi:hypothetical protein